MKKLLLTLALLLAPSLAMAQCNGVFPNNTACGNTTGSSNTPRPIPLSSFPTNSPGGTNGQIQYNNGGAFGGFTASGDATINTTTGVVTLNPIASGDILANTTGSPAHPIATPGSSWFDVAFCNTIGYLIARTTGGWVCAKGVPLNLQWYGVVADGTTDNSATANAAIVALQTANAGGTVLLPDAPGLYCFFSGITINSGTTVKGVILTGTSVEGTKLSTCGHNVTLITLNDQWSQALKLTAYGYGSFTTDPVFTTTPPTTPTILMSSGCTSCRIQDLYSTGGTAAIEIGGACGYILDNAWGSFSYGDGTHVQGLLYNINCGGTIWNSHFDMVWPISQPAHGTTIGTAWAGSTPYTVGAIVYVTCNSISYYIQAANSGTSGSSSPGCAPFGGYSHDNVTGTCPTPSAGICWALVNAVNSYCIQFDTGTIEAELIQTDATCAAAYNIGYSNTFAGTAPTQSSIIRSTPGGGFAWNLLISSTTSHITILGLETSYVTASGGGGVLINGVASGINILGLDCLNGFAYCVDMTAAANNVTVSGMHSTGADTADFNVAAAATGFMLTNSTHVSGAANFYTIGSVAADHYQISGNICNGTSASDSGSGTHKNVVACSGSNP